MRPELSLSWAWLVRFSGLAIIAAIVVGSSAPVRSQGAGAAQGTPPEVDFAPKDPYLPQTPEKQAAGFILPAGYRMEIVLSEPDVISPVAVEFDANGRMYVAEMISYMMDAEATNEHDPLSRITRYESTQNNGVYDKRTVFAENLIAPRLILPLEDGAILTSETDSLDLLKLSDTNGDGVADKREVVWTGIGRRGNIEHQESGLVWGLDNWIYTTYNSFRLRWTPGGFVRESTGSNGGQWGLAMDNDGKMWFVNAGGERGPVNFQYPIHYGSFTPCGAPGGRGNAAPVPNPNCPQGIEDGFETGFRVVWPAPGIGDMQGGPRRTRMPAQNLNHFTATTGPAIFRGHRLPEDLEGDLLFTEPVGRLIRRAKIENIEGLTVLRNAYPGSEFINSEDQLFRPVNISNAPDGTLYISDMYHGIIQERQWSGPGTYLRAKIEQYDLDKVVTYGRVWRLRYDGRPAVPETDTNRGQAAIPALQPDFTRPQMYSETPAQLVAHLSHENGWWRDNAQRQLVLRQDTSVVPALEQMARTSTTPASRPAGGAGASASSAGSSGDDGKLLGRFHALWTLEGLGALDAELVRELMRDENPRMRIQAMRASETLYKDGDESFAADYRRLSADPDVNVAIQALLSLSLFDVEDFETVARTAKAAREARGLALIADRLLEEDDSAVDFGDVTEAERTVLLAGMENYNSLCASCHGDDGQGVPLAGSTPGEMMAPPLGGSSRVQGHRDYVIKVLLHGLTGPIGGRTYTQVMVPMGVQDDAWLAGVASYVRNAFGNAAGMVSAADVARVRAATKGRTTMWTVAELEAAVPTRLSSEGLRTTASHGTDVDKALTLRGWTTGEPQRAGMWYQIELPEPARVAEIRFDSPSQGGRGRNSVTPPQVQAPLAYSVQVSMDGQTWSDPVAQGSDAGSSTTIAFEPTQAKFIHITQTAPAPPNAPAWSMNNLQVWAVE
jgi:mono/diheme cytochrome c family protein/glucose/arabinose dehydrogenase